MSVQGQTTAGLLNQERFTTALRLVDVLYKHGGTATCLDWAHNVTRRMAETIACVTKADNETWGMVQELLRRDEFSVDFDRAVKAMGEAS